MNSPNQFDQEFNKAIGQNARLKSKILSFFFGLITLGQLISFAFLKAIDHPLVANVSVGDVYFIPVVMAIIFASQVFSFFYISKLLLEGKQFRMQAGYMVGFLEATMPTLMIYLICTYFPQNGLLSFDNIMNGPPVFLYILFIIISSLYLDFKLSVFMGIVSAIQYTFMLFLFMESDLAGVSLPLMLFKGFFFIVCGVISGFVSQRIKDSIIQSLESKNELINTLDIKVKEKTHEIAKQNELLAEKNKNITDSINYAKRIQTAILPPDRVVDNYLPEYFILYLPKDVVSGDFYFVDKVDQKVVFAAVDCTGHGVPGALMSVVGFNYLSQAVSEKKLSKPSEILKYLDQGVNQTLRQSGGSGVNDGMDLSLCTYDFSSGELQFAGAFNPLWLIKKDSDGQGAGSNHFVEVKADKFPIGTNQDGKPDEYSNHVIKLRKGDSIYLFSDGYADQFGGPKGKKFKYRQLQETLISIQGKSMTEQKDYLSNIFSKWRGDLEQVDDICIIGVRV